LKWTAGRAVIEDVVCRANDEDVLRLVERASKTGIDCPFGWPAAFVGFVSTHHANQPVPARAGTVRAATSPCAGQTCSSTSS
jgi:hypothetical protein